MKRPIILLCVIFLSLICTGPALAKSPQWQELDTGLDYINFPLSISRGPAQDSGLHVLRINPSHWEFVLLTAKSTGEKGFGRTVHDWLIKEDLTAAINAGMFQEDWLRNAGFMKGPNGTNNSHLNRYKSMFAFAPKTNSNIPSAAIYDLDMTSFSWLNNSYSGLIQNLRLIKQPGENRWSEQAKFWSEAALAQDTQGNILFLFSLTPMSMFDFNEKILNLPLKIVAAQHLEGGPEASFELSHPKKQISTCGSFETGFNENFSNYKQLPVPNVLGIKPRE